MNPSGSAKRGVESEFAEASGHSGNSGAKDDDRATDVIFGRISPRVRPVSHWLFLTRGWRLISGSQVCGSAPQN